MTTEELQRLEQGCRLDERIKQTMSDIVDFGLAPNITIGFYKNGQWFQVRNLDDHFMAELRHNVIQHLEKRKEDYRQQFAAL